MKKIDLVWGISLIIIGIISLVLSVTGIIGFEIPDTAKRIIGIIDLIALLILVFSSVIKFKNNKKINSN